MQVNVTGAVNVDTAAANADISLTSTTGDLLIGLLAAGNGTVTLASAAAIKDTNGAAMNVTAGALALSAVTGIGLEPDPIEVAVPLLAATTQTGGIYINNTGSVVIGTVGGVTGVSVTSASAQGHIVLHTTQDMTVNKPVSNSGSGDIRLTSGHDITLNDMLNASGGQISVTADHNVYQNSSINNTAGGGVAVTAVNGNIVMASDAQTTVGQGAVDYSAQQDLTVSGITTGTGGSATITANNGSILDGNGGAPNVSSTQLTVTAPSGAAAEGNNSEFLFAFGSSAALPDLIIFNNRVLGGDDINQFYQALTMGNGQIALGDFFLYNTLFDDIWKWSGNSQMLLPMGAPNPALPYMAMAGFTM
jgi:hypothetical protein